MDESRFLSRWKAAAAARPGPRYVAIRESLEAAVAEGEVRAGIRLPPQRVIARALGVDLTTVSRALQDAQRRGVVVTRGRGGSFVARAMEVEAVGEPCELAVNHPPPLERAAQSLVVEAMRRAVERGGPELLEYPRGIPRRHAAAGAAWCSALGHRVQESRIASAGGSQQALLGILAMMCEPGDSIVTTRLTYQGLLVVARRLSVRIATVESDAEGMVPDSLADICARVKPRFVYAIPTFDNPTAATAGLERRQQLAQVIGTAGTRLLEDDEHAALLDRPLAPIASYIPEQSWYIASLSKSLSPGVRTAYIACPTSDAARSLTGGLISLGQFASAVTAEAAAELVSSGQAEAVTAAMRRAAAARWSVAREVLPQLHPGIASTNHFGWLALPDRWRSEAFAAAARARGVQIMPADAFAAVPGQSPRGVRVCLGGPPAIEPLKRGLEVLAQLLQDDPGYVLPLL